MSSTISQPEPPEYEPENAMEDRDDITRFHDRCSDLMRELLHALAATPDQPRTFPEVEDALKWPRRRLASVLGAVWHLRTTEFAGHRPYRLIDESDSSTSRWEIWMDSTQTQVILAAVGS
jgi:hypothetical protein